MTHFQIVMDYEFLDDSYSVMKDDLTQATEVDS